MLVQTWGLIFFLFVGGAVACDVEPHEFMLSQVRGFGGAGANESGITQEQFQQTFTRLLDHYEKDFTDRGLEVQRILDWENGWVNAQTGWTGAKSVKFFFSGALARSKYMTTDALLYVGCHEVGHHFGGFPKKDGKWSTAEGGADYFAALKCMRAVLRNDPENARDWDVPAEVKAKCREVYSNEDEFHLCLRTAKAGDDMAKAFLHRRGKEEDSLLLSVLPDVSATNTSGYPSPECRAVTAFAGAVCFRGPEFPTSFTDEVNGYCHEKNGDVVGMRPRCWFKPVEE